MCVLQTEKIGTGISARCVLVASRTLMAVTQHTQISNASEMSFRVPVPEHLFAIQHACLSFLL